MTACDRLDGAWCDDGTCAICSLQAEATISYEALSRQREATKAAEAEVVKERAWVEDGGNWEDRALAAERSLAEAVGALEFYADPETYFAWGFISDPPCGDFGDDFSETELGVKPGKRARSTLSRLAEKETNHG
jgi:hypothetical protein